MAANILVTGAAGFIGSTLSHALLARGDTVVGVDNLNDYYDVNLKKARLARLEPHERFSFHLLDVTDQSAINDLFASEKFDIVVHLAAQAGVRYSLENPHAYINANIVGFMNILEAARHAKCPHLVYASSSSVYGGNTKQPFSVSDNVDHPVSLYAATKKSNELMAHCYSHLYGLPTTGLRFFTVYGPWGRPDMALFKFTHGIVQGESIDVYNHGNMIRDFTYVDDIVSGICKVTQCAPQPDVNWQSDTPDPANSAAPYRVYNIGNNQPVKLMDFVHAIEKAVGKKAQINFCDLQPGDVPATQADVSHLEADFDYAPNTPIQVGIDQFVAWYREYYNLPA